MSKIVEPEILLLDDNLVVRQNQIKESPIFSTPKVNQFLENGNSQISPIEREEILKEQIKQYLSTSSPINMNDFIGILPIHINDREKQLALQKERKEALEKARLEALEKSAESFKDSETTPSIAKDNSKLINIALLGAVGFLVYKLLK
jgi:hypothetical protein